MGFREVEALKLPAPRWEAGKVVFMGYVSCWKCSAHTNISKAARSWGRQWCELGRSLVVLGVDSALKWPWPGVCAPAFHHGAEPPSAPGSRSQGLQAACAALALHTEPQSCLCCALQSLQGPPSWDRPLQGPAGVAELSQLRQAVCGSWLESGAADCQVLTRSFIFQLIQRQRELGVNEAGCGCRQVRIACVPLVGMNHQ